MFYACIYSTDLIRLQCVTVNVILKMFACGQIFQFQRKSVAKFSSIQTGFEKRQSYTLSIIHLRDSLF